MGNSMQVVVTTPFTVSSANSARPSNASSSAPNRRRSARSPASFRRSPRPVYGQEGERNSMQTVKELSFSERNPYDSRYESPEDRDSEAMRIINENINDLIELNPAQRPLWADANDEDMFE